MTAENKRLCQCHPPEAGRDGYTCDRCEDVEVAAVQRAVVKRLAAEVAYLREHRAWVASIETANLSDRCRMAVASSRHVGNLCRNCEAWLRANPEPQPPEGVEP